MADLRLTAANLATAIALTTTEGDAETLILRALEETRREALEEAERVVIERAKERPVMLGPWHLNDAYRAGLKSAHDILRALYAPTGEEK